MKAAGFEPSSAGTQQCYEGIPDIFIQDIRDTEDVSGSIRLDTLMTSEEKSISLAKEILNLVGIH
jgi:LPPG:FO 2-phospho-L-lactate transferase